MQQRLKRYVVTMLALVTLGVTYELTFVRWLEPDPIEPLEFAQTPGLHRNESLAALFPADAWQQENCKRLQTRDGALLFENWEQIGDDQWKLWPLTVVLGMNSESPLILDAEEGAEIKFSESLDVMSGGAPPIERGRMIGQVRIRSVGNGFDMGRPGGEAAHLEIVSSDFGIDFRKIWTTQPISVRMGGIRLAGRDLTLHLAPLGRIQPGGEGGLSILNRMELIYLDELTVPLPGGGLWQVGNQPSQTSDAAVSSAGEFDQEPQTTDSISGDGGSFGNSSDTSPEPASAKLRCAGRVIFNFASNELTLHDRVRLEHRTATEIDQFDCELLKLQFANLFRPVDEPSPSLGLKNPAGHSQPAAEQIGDYLHSIVAEGQPARIKLPSFLAEVAAEQIHFDARAGLLQMTGSAGARISYSGHTWRFKQFSYQLNPQDPTQIGAFDAIGSGLVEFGGPTPLPVKRLRWTDGIKLDQPDENGQFSLRVDGDVTALMNDDGRFSCDSVLLVMQAGSHDLTGDSWLRSVRPQRFQATGRVNMQSPMVDVATRLLRLYFDFDETPETQSATATTATAHPLRQWVRQPDDERRNENGTTANLVGSASPVSGPRPTVHGDTINARLRISGTELTASDLTVVGDVSLKHSLRTPTGTLPAVLTGQRLQIRDSSGDEILQIGSGIDDPARLAVGDGYFIGPMIQVRLADNLVWINDAGEFQLPSEMLPRVAAGKPTPTPLESSADVANQPTDRRSGRGGEVLNPGTMPLKWVSPPRCRWRGQMLFDGARVVLTDGIDIRGTVMVGREQDVWDISLIGDQLRVAFDQPVAMRELDSIRSTTIRQVMVTSSDNNPLLVTANQLTSRGVRKGRHLLAAPELTFVPESSLLSGPGPGWYRAWMQTAATSLSAGVTSDGRKLGGFSLTGMHLVYKESFEANLANQSLDFYTGVRVASRPVKAWDDLIDAEAMQGLRLGESTLDCQRLRLGVDSTRQRSDLDIAWEMEALGGVLFQTRNDRGLFNGQAQRATYTAAKDVFLIEGDAARSATMHRTLPTGAAGENVAVKRMSVNTRTMEVINVEFDRLQLGTLPNLSR